MRYRFKKGEVKKVCNIEIIKKRTKKSIVGGMITRRKEEGE